RTRINTHCIEVVITKIMSIPRTPSPPSSPPETRTPLLSGGSHVPWDRTVNQHHLQQALSKYSPLTGTPRPRYHAPVSRKVPTSPGLPEQASLAFVAAAAAAAAAATAVSS